MSDRHLEPPWVNDPPNPCEECSPDKIPEGFDCQEGENWENCPRWNPEPITCDVCGREISKGDMCLSCEREEEKAALKFEMEDGEY
jgi:hypothetical protein